jgi:hypothetical protein
MSWTGFESVCQALFQCGIQAKCFAERLSQSHQNWYSFFFFESQACNKMGLLDLALYSLILLQSIGFAIPLNPMPLRTWEKRWTAAPIELSVANENATGVTATFFITPTTTITNGVFEVEFPSGFGVS